MQKMLQRVEEALLALKNKRMVILTDDASRENEGDLIFPAECSDAAKINFMLRHCSGIICLALTAQQSDKLKLPLMVAAEQNTTKYRTAFTVSIEAKVGVSTGVSASDRAQTILTAIADDTTADDLARPGHVFPLRAHADGVLGRQGHTEGSVDLVQLAGFKPAAVICEVMNPDGTMCSGDDLTVFAHNHQIAMVSIADLIAYRLAKESQIAEEATTTLPLAGFGEFTVTAFKEKFTQKEHIVLQKRKDGCADQETLVRIHSSCLTGDLFGSLRCDCHDQLTYALKRISAEGGVLIYLNQEGRGIGIFNKIKAYALQEQGLDTIQANECLGFAGDTRRYYIAGHILQNLGINKIKVLTNNPEKLAYLNLCGYSNAQHEPMPVFCSNHNKHYLQTKITKLNHMMSLASSLD